LLTPPLGRPYSRTVPYDPAWLDVPMILILARYGTAPA